MGAGGIPARSGVTRGAVLGQVSAYCPRHRCTAVEGRTRLLGCACAWADVDLQIAEHRRSRLVRIAISAIRAERETG